MDRILIVPAAGRGSRLGGSLPKALTLVAGRPMLEHLLALHRTTVDHAVIVVAPAAHGQFVAFAESHPHLALAIQPETTGMLDAILAAHPVVAAHAPRRVAITWCDQIAVTAQTVTRLRERALAPDAPALILPTIRVPDPYIHFDRDDNGRIAGVRQRREGDEMPAAGEADMGLFDLSLEAYLNDLEAFAREAKPAEGTRERNFLPFIPWLARRQPVETIAGVAPIEAVGINTPEELAAIEAHLQREHPPSA